jgi:hypothetical protein
MKLEARKDERGDIAIRKNRHKPSGKQPSREPAAQVFVLPNWIPVESWNGFTEMRQKIRKPLTDRAVSLIVKELGKLKAKGHAPGDVLDQSVRNDWQDVYPLKGENRNGNRHATGTTRKAQAQLDSLEQFREAEARTNSRMAERHGNSDGDRNRPKSATAVC